MNKIILCGGIIALLIGAGFVLYKYHRTVPLQEIIEDSVDNVTRDYSLNYTNRDSEALPKEQVAIPQSLSEIPIANTQKKIKTTVPFIVQAPSGQWSDAVFQNGCEEASLLMAYVWVRGESPPTKEGVETKIRALSSMAEMLFGKHTYDTSAVDTIAIAKRYFQSNNITFKNDVSVEDLRRMVEQGSLVIVPVDGRLLKNPHYTAPGPEHHMLVITGYDSTTKEFITNDPGTRFGAGWRYSEDILYRAIGDYPTGDHQPRVGAYKKVAIEVKR